VEEYEVLLFLQLFIGADGIQHPQRRLLLPISVESIHFGIHVILAKRKIGVVIATGVETLRA
jgi:hypothetical protein